MKFHANWLMNGICVHSIPTGDGGHSGLKPSMNSPAPGQAQPKERGLFQGNDCCADSHQASAHPVMPGQFFVEEHCSKKDGENQAEFVDRNRAGGVAFLQRLKEADPADGGRETGKNQEEPGAFFKGGKLMPFAGESDHESNHDNHDQAPDGDGDVGADAFHPHFCENISQADKERGEECPKKPVHG